MEESKKQTIKIKILQYASLISMSIITGILIALFQVAIKYLFKAINSIYDSSIETVSPLLIYSSICIVVVSAFYIVARYLKLTLSKGTYVLSRYLSKEKVKFYEYPFLLIGFGISLFAGLPVGAVEVCQCMGVGLASELYKRTDIKDPDSFDSISSASFGAAFMSPLAGFFYGLESRKWKVTWSYVIKMALSVAFAMGSCYLMLMLFKLQNNFMFRMNMFEKFSWKSLWVYALMGVIIAGSAFILNLSTLKLKNVFESNKKFKNMATIFTAIILIVALLCTFFGLEHQWYTFSLAGYDGSRIISNFDRFKRIGLLMGTLFLWIFYLLLIPHSKLIGGKIVPLLTMGGLIGICCVWNAKDNNLINPDEFFMMISVGMFALFGVVYKKPVTAFCLALTFSRWAIIPYQLIPLILAIVPGYLLLTFTKLPSWNECLGIPDSLRITEDVKEEDMIVAKKRHK